MDAIIHVGGIPHPRSSRRWTECQQFGKTRLETILAKAAVTLASRSPKVCDTDNLRRRGGEPGSSLLMSRYKQPSPQAWRSTLVEQTASLIMLATPAGAAVNPAIPSNQQRPTAYPRGSGGVPLAYSITEAAEATVVKMVDFSNRTIVNQFQANSRSCSLAAPTA